jgi:hypothetical protein
MKKGPWDAGWVRSVLSYAQVPTWLGEVVGASLSRYRGANVNFVRVWLRSGGFFKAHRANELVEIVDDALVETVELGLLVGL